MVVPEDVLAQARKLLENAARPLFFHDDDCDGVSSFIQCFQFCNEGFGVCVKQSPVVLPEYLRKVEEHQPDVIVILDKPDVDPEFFSSVQQPVLWIDHHQPRTDLVKKFPNVLYVNPRIWDDKDNLPTSYWAYKIAKKNLWIAVVGCVADWHIPDYLGAFDQKYPGFLPEKFSKVEELYLDTRLGELIKVIQFNLKGTTTDVRKSILTLSRIEDPNEILQQTTARGKFIWKKYKKLSDGYNKHLALAKKEAQDAQNVLLYAYEDAAQTYTTELSNELLIRFPDKVTLVCRKNDNKRKCSVRSHSVELPTKINVALQGLEGRGGGHTNACGVVVAEKDWDEFYARFKTLVDEETR